MEDSEPSMSDVPREFMAAHKTFTPMPAWPWRISGQFNMPVDTITGMQVPCTAGTQWPSASTPVANWASPYAQGSPPIFLGPAAKVRVWPYPSVPDMGYNTVPLMHCFLGIVPCPSKTVLP